MGRLQRSVRFMGIRVLVAGAAAAVTGLRWFLSPSADSGFSTLPGASSTPAALGPAVWSPGLETIAAAAQERTTSQPAIASHPHIICGLVAVGSGAMALRQYSGTRSKRRSGRSFLLKRAAVLPEKVTGQAIGTFPPRPTPLLDSLNDEGPQKLRDMTTEQLIDLAAEVRWQVLDATSVTGGHLGSALGVVELTVALHHIFDTPRDEIVWDVAHQVYPHKVLTGRRGRIYTLRQGGGLSGFAKRSESEYDAFGAGHSGTSISAALGFQVARDMRGELGRSIAVIGDGAITGGMAWEAMNHAGGLKSKMIVILNDNGQVSLPTMYNNVDQPVGALAEMLASQEAPSQRGLAAQGNIARIETSQAFQVGRKYLKSFSQKVLPAKAASAVAKIDEYTRDFWKTAPFQGSGAGAKGELFEQLGFFYVGPIDGHDIPTMVSVLGNLKRGHEEGLISKPILLHVKTTKGKGYLPAELAGDRLHAVKPRFNLTEPTAVLEEQIARPEPVPLTTVFGEALVREAERDEKIVAVTAAMPGGTGVSIFENRFGPSRTFDVGIAEQHAVTFAASMAAAGLKPFVCIYSTFLQRGYDQVVHDVALQNLPVRFVLDRGGLVGDDGPTHAGSFDLTYLACIPNLQICAPSDEAEVAHMTHTLAMLDDGPSVMRYPRGVSYGDVDMPKAPEFLEPGKGRIVRRGREGGVAILSVGARLRESLEAAERLESWGIAATVADARWVKPLDEALVKQLAADHKVLITVEENSIGGFSAQVSHVLHESGCFDGNDRKPLVFREMVLPDRYIGADVPRKQYDDAELNATHIMTKIVAALNSAGEPVDAREAREAFGEGAEMQQGIATSS